jgi:hypothetical protein
MDMTSKETAAGEAQAAETPPGISRDDPATASVQIGSLLSAASSKNSERRPSTEPAGSPPCVPPAACIESIDFSYGILDLLVVVCSNLIARRLFIDRLKKIEAAGRQGDSHIVNSTLTDTRN